MILDVVTSPEKINRVPDTWYVDNDLEYTFIFAIPTTKKIRNKLNLYSKAKHIALDSLNCHPGFYPAPSYLVIPGNIMPIHLRNETETTNIQNEL